LAALKPLFESDGTAPAGTISAGNASGVNDGAAILLLASEEATRKHGWKPMAQLTAGTSTGCDPQKMGLGPVHAIRKLLGQLGKNLQDFDRVEINEAFAAQVLACLRMLEVRVNLAQPDVSTGILAGIPIQLNGHGGAIAIGHPLAASGARLLTHLAWQIAQGRSKNCLASLCIGGGMGIAAALSNP
jgi:acetyl-CoA acetyltransferase family protein